MTPQAQEPAGPGVAMTQAGVHCWKDKGEWADETFGFLSDEHLATLENGATCLLADGHEGPHEWTDDGAIVINFAPERTP